MNPAPSHALPGFPPFLTSLTQCITMDKRASWPAEYSGTLILPPAVLAGTVPSQRPGRVIALLNQKGGAGKTTLATHLAGELAWAGRRVTLLDADPQGSALDWAQRRAQSGLERLYGVFGLARDTLHHETPQIAQEADFVIIDGPPRVAALARSALLAADLERYFLARTSDGASDPGRARGVRTEGGVR